MQLPDSLARFNRVGTNKVMRPLARRVPYMGVVHHVGRKSGRPYETPVLLTPIDGGFLIPLTYGPDRDWVHNVVAAQGAELEIRGRRRAVNAPELVGGDARPAGLPGAWSTLLDRLNLEALLVVCRTVEAAT